MTIGVASADQRTGQRVGKDQGRWRSTVSAVGGWRFRRLGKGLAREAKGRERERGYERFRHVLPPLTRNRVHKSGSDGNLQNGPQTAKPRLAQSYVAAVDPRHVTG